MSRVAEMQSLTEHLARSYAERIAAGAARYAEVQAALQAARESVSMVHDARLEAAAVRQQALAEDDAARRAAVAGSLAGFSQARAAMGASQRAALNRATAVRQSEVRGMRSHTQHLLQEVHTARAASDAILHGALRQGRADLSETMESLLEGFQHARADLAARQVQAAAAQREAAAADRAELAAETASFLAEVGAERTAMAGAQEEALEAGRAARHTAVAATLAEFQTARAALAGDLAAFSQAWQSFTQTMQAHRTGLGPTTPSQPAAEAPSAPPPPAPVVAEAAEPAPVAAAVPEAADPTPVAEVVAEVPQIASEDAVFSYLADHPDGVRPAELQENFSVSRNRMMQILSRLVDENRARRDHERGLYFAV